MKVFNFGIVNIFVILQVLQVLCTESRFCEISLSTLRYPFSCPSTKTAFDIAANRLGCDSLSKKQNCTTSSNFKYHCVMNVFENETIEVCAPALYIMGYCAEFNIQGGRIQPHYQTKCTEMDPPCPKRYISTDAFQYTSCFKKVKDKSTSSSKEKGDDSTDSIIIITVSTIPAVLLIFVVLIIIVCRRTKRQSTDDNNENEMENLLDVKDNIKENGDQPYIYKIIQRGKKNAKFPAMIFARSKDEAANDIDEISENDRREVPEDGDEITLENLENKIMQPIDSKKDLQQSVDVVFQDGTDNLFHILASLYPESQKNINARKDLCEFELQHMFYFKMFHYAHISEAKSLSSAFEDEMKKLLKRSIPPTLREIYAASEMLRVKILLVRKTPNSQKGILICPFIQGESSCEGYEEIEMLGSEENPLFQHNGHRDLKEDSRDENLVILNKEHAFCLDRRFRNSFDVFFSQETSFRTFRADENNYEGSNFFDILAKLMYGDCLQKQLVIKCVKEHIGDKAVKGFYEQLVDVKEYEHEAVLKIENEIKNDSDKKNKQITKLKPRAFKSHVKDLRAIGTGDLFAASSILNIDIYIKEEDNYQLIRPVSTTVGKIWNSPLILERKSKTNFIIQISSNSSCLCKEDLPYLKGTFANMSIAINKQLIQEIDLQYEKGICCKDTSGNHKHMERISNSCRWRSLSCFCNSKKKYKFKELLSKLSEEELEEDKIIENYLRIEGRCVDTFRSSNGTLEVCLSKAVLGFESKLYARHLRYKDPEVCLQKAADNLKCPIYVFKYSLQYCRWVTFKPKKLDQESVVCKFYITLLQRNNENGTRYEVITPQDVQCNCLLPQPRILTFQNKDNIEKDEVTIEREINLDHIRALKTLTFQEQEKHRYLKLQVSSKEKELSWDGHSETKQNVEEFIDTEQSPKEATEVRRVPYLTYISEMRVLFSKTNSSMSTRMIDYISDLSFSLCRCLSKEVYGIDTYFEAIRDSIISEIKANESYYKKTIEKQLKCILPNDIKLKPIPEVCCQLIRDGFELDVEIKAAANLLQTPIYVISVTKKENGFCSSWKKYKVTKEENIMKGSYITLYKDFAGRFHRVVRRKVNYDIPLAPPVTNVEILESTADYDLDYARIQAFRMTENQFLKAKIMFQDWVRCNYILDIVLDNVIAKIENRRKNTNIASLAGAGIGTVGAIMSGVGIAVAPLTAGVSLGFVIAGGVISGLGGITNIGAKLTEFGLNKADIRLAEEYETNLRILSKQLEENLSKLDDCLSSLRKATGDGMQDIPVDSIAVCLRSLSGLTSIPFLVLRALARAVAEVDAILVPLSAAIDIYTAAKAIRSLSEGSLSSLSLKFRTTRCLLRLTRKQMLVWAYGSNTKTIDNEEKLAFKAIHNVFQVESENS